MTDFVFALTVYNGELIAGGHFTTAGGVACNRIARWNGSTWQALGSGMDDEVLALAVYNGELVAGGYFTTAGGVTCNYIARWDGGVWQPLGSGMSAEHPWWVSVGALTVYNGEVIAGGRFTSAGGVACSSIARWNGSVWQPLGTGMDPVGYPPYVFALTLYPPPAGELIAGGDFTTAGGVTCNHIARWDASAWQPLGSGTGGTYPEVLALTAYRGELIAGGDFATAGSYPSSCWARWRCPPCVGDLNCDGFIDLGDINPFVAYLSNYSAWQAEFTGCNPLNGDINGDGTYGQESFGDINPFVELLITGQGPCP